MSDTKNKSQISQKKLEANRLNAKRSTGPITTAGKARASENSYQHGFFSRRLFPSEEQKEKDGADYNRMSKYFSEHYSPQGPLEHFWLEKMTVEALRLSRILGFEETAFGRGPIYLEHLLDKLTRYESAVSRQFEKAIERFEDLQRERKVELAEREAAESDSESTDTGDSGKVNPSNTTNPIPPVGATEEASLRESVEAGAIDQRLTEICGTKPTPGKGFAEFTDDVSASSASVYPEVMGAEEPAQFRTAFGTVVTTPPIGPTENELLEAIDLGP